MKTIRYGMWVLMACLLALASPAWGEPGVTDKGIVMGSGSAHNGRPAMSLTESIQQNRLMVVEVKKHESRVHVKGESGLRMSLTCDKRTLVVTDDETMADLAFLNPGDIIRVETKAGSPMRLVVVRRAWQEMASPEL